MEVRHVIAYTLLALLIGTGSVAAVIVARRRAARKRRLRGIKDDERLGTPVKSRIAG